MLIVHNFFSLSLSFSPLFQSMAQCHNKNPISLPLSVWVTEYAFQCASTQAVTMCLNNITNALIDNSFKNIMLIEDKFCNKFSEKYCCVINQAGRLGCTTARALLEHWNLKFVEWLPHLSPFIFYLLSFAFSFYLSPALNHCIHLSSLFEPKPNMNWECAW